MSMAQSRRASGLFGTGRLARSYASPASTRRGRGSDLAVVALFSIVGLAVSLLLTLSYPPDAVQTMLVALLS